MVDPLNSPLPPAPPVAPRAAAPAAGAAAPPPISDVSLAERIQQILYSTLVSLERTWRYLKNPTDPDWRKNQKYAHVMEEMRRGLKTEMAKDEQLARLITKFEAHGHRGMQTVNYEKGSLEETLHHMEKALLILYDPPTPYDDQRERYKAFMDAYLKALKTDYYKKQVKEGEGLSPGEMRALEADNPIVGCLHAIAYVQFSQVNTLGFTQSVAREMQEVGELNLPEKEQGPEVVRLEGTPDEKKTTLFQAVERECDRIGEAHHAITAADTDYKMSWWTKLGTTIKGHSEFLDFDPLHTGGNPANIHHKRVYADGSEVTIIRSPSPTIGPYVSPDFKAFLRALRSREETYLYGQLQDRRLPSKMPKLKDRVKADFGIPREDLRAHSIEALERSPEFKGTIHVITLDKNSPFYWQHDKKNGYKILNNLIERGIIKDPKEITAFKKGLDHKNQYGDTFDLLVALYRMHSPDKSTEPTFAMQQREAFIKQFKDNLFKEGGSFYIPTGLDDAQRVRIKQLVDEVADAYFPGRDYLTPSERQDLIELTYDLLTDQLATAFGASKVQIACKDCIDRGEGQEGLKEGKDLLLEVVGTRGDEYREDLLKDIQSMHETINAAALWARKRPILDERLVRMVHAWERMNKLAKSNPETFLRLNTRVQGYRMPDRVWAQANPEQKVKDFKKDRHIIAGYKRMINKASGKVTVQFKEVFLQHPQQPHDRDIE